MSMSILFLLNIFVLFEFSAGFNLFIQPELPKQQNVVYQIRVYCAAKTCEDGWKVCQIMGNEMYFDQLKGLFTWTRGAGSKALGHNCPMKKYNVEVEKMRRIGTDQFEEINKTKKRQNCVQLQDDSIYTVYYEGGDDLEIRRPIY